MVVRGSDATIEFTNRTARPRSQLAARESRRAWRCTAGCSRCHRRLAARRLVAQALALTVEVRIRRWLVLRAARRLDQHLSMAVLLPARRPRQRDWRREPCSARRLAAGVAPRQAVTSVPARSTADDHRGGDPTTARARQDAQSPTSPARSAAAGARSTGTACRTRFAAPNALPANFFNVNSPRGVVFIDARAPASRSARTPRIRRRRRSSSATSTRRTPGFFAPFSAQRLFTAIGSNIVDVNFFVPGSAHGGADARLRRGLHRCRRRRHDVDPVLRRDDTLLGTVLRAADVAGNETFSFLGVDFTAAPVVSRVRITSGDQLLGRGQRRRTDLVVMDDFIYGEPLAVPRAGGPRADAGRPRCLARRAAPAPWRPGPRSATAERARAAARPTRRSSDGGGAAGRGGLEQAVDVAVPDRDPSVAERKSRFRT